MDCIWEILQLSLNIQVAACHVRRWRGFCGNSCVGLGRPVADVRGHRRTEFWIPTCLFLAGSAVPSVSSTESALFSNILATVSQTLYPVSILVAEFGDTGWFRYWLLPNSPQFLTDQSSTPVSAHLHVLVHRKILSAHERNIWASMIFSILSVSLLLTFIIYGKNIVIMK